MFDARCRAVLAALFATAVAAATPAARAEVAEVRISYGFGILYLPLMVMDREKLLEMAFNDISITYKLYTELGGPATYKQFDKLLKEIEKQRGAPAPKGLAGLKETQQAAGAAGS
jgi:hypothetical protein